MEYDYTAVSPQGTQIQGRVQALTEAEALQRLHGQEYVVLALKAEGKGSVKGAPAGLRLPAWGKRRLKMEHVVMLSRELSIMMETGIPLLEALAALQEHAEHPELAAALSTMRADLGAGKTLSQALAAHPRIFPRIYVDMARTAETGGSLTDTLDQAATYMESALEMRRKISAAMTYPIVVMSVAFLVVLFMFMYLLPMFGDMFQKMQADVPPLTGAMLVVSAFIRGNWWLLPVLLVAGKVAYALIGRRPRVRLVMARVTLRIPILGDTVRKIVVARLLRSLGTLLNSGVPLLVALDTAIQTAQNMVFERAMAQVRLQIEQGGALSTGMIQTRIFPGTVSQMVAVGEKSGKLSEVLLRVADFYDREVDARLKALASILEPVMIVSLGVVVGVIAISIILPIYSLISSVK
ncbi:MAG TPA: type II secretion system F family protein [Chthonomonadaceae bacterium]|nr:type II secretion system F family protein [Chthonomonadaceae bacterium]